jgi:DNA-binding NarL/FixJ family response regulator
LSASTIEDAAGAADAAERTRASRKKAGLAAAVGVSVRGQASPAAPPLSIVVIDDHQFMRGLIIRMLDRHSARFKVVADGADARSALSACQEFAPDLLVLDINLPDESGIEAVPKLKRVSPRTRILLCTAYVTDDRFLDASQCGADGFIEKTHSWKDFVDAIERVGRGERHFRSGSIASAARASTRLVDSLACASTVALSAREKQVLIEICRGSTSKEVAQTLRISAATVDTHRRNLMKKLHIRNLASLVVFGLRAGLIKL